MRVCLGRFLIDSNTIGLSENISASLVLVIFTVSHPYKCFLGLVRLCYRFTNSPFPLMVVCSSKKGSS